MTMTSQHDIDPFAGGDSVPSLSFKNAPVGTVYTGTVTEAPTLVQSRDYKTGEPAFWPATNGQPGNPKMAVVIKIALDTGEERSVWATKPSAMFAAIKTAQQEAGQKIAVGGTLAIKFTGEKPNADTKKEPQKLYAAKYTPPAAPDAFADSTPAPQAAPVNTATVFNGTQGGGAQPPF